MCLMYGRFWYYLFVMIIIIVKVVACRHPLYMKDDGKRRDGSIHARNPQRGDAHKSHNSTVSSANL